MNIYEITKLIEEFFTTNDHYQIREYYSDKMGGYCWRGAFTYLNWNCMIMHTEPKTLKLIYDSDVTTWNDEEQLTYQEINNRLIERYEKEIKENHE